MTADEKDDIERIAITGGAIYAGYLVLKPLLYLFGADPADKAAVQSVDNAVPGDNPFNYQYQPFLDAISNLGYTDVSTWAQSAKSGYSSATPDQIANFALVSSGYGLFPDAIIAENIYSSFGFLKIFGTDTATVSAMFNDINCKGTVAAVDAYLQFNYNTSLWGLLKNGSGGQLRGLNPSDLAVIVNRVNALPDC